MVHKMLQQIYIGILYRESIQIMGQFMYAIYFTRGRVLQTEYLNCKARHGPRLCPTGLPPMDGAFIPHLIPLIRNNNLFSLRYI